MPPVQTDYVIDESTSIKARWNSGTGDVSLIFGTREEVTLRLSWTAADRVICLLQAISEGR
jgi:hypothetical protein